MIGEVATYFAREDPARPDLRSILDDCLERLQEFKEQVETFVGAGWTAGAGRKAAGEGAAYRLRRPGVGLRLQFGSHVLAV